MSIHTDTVAAISTPYGRGGVALIRISGDDAVSVAEKVFAPKSGKRLGDHPPRYAVFGSIISDGRSIDEGIATFFRAPASYTGEDVVEISCHGGILISSMVLEAVFAAGAQPAGAGEFTKRAFLSGKLSLSQSEAVIDLIDARSEEQLRLARSHLGGVLSEKIDSLYQRLCILVSSAYVYADYPDEDLSDVGSDAMLSELRQIKSELVTLRESYKRGKAVREGIYTVIAGRPNTGKSSLLNCILERERAIVSDIAGTTRDTVEEKVQFGRVMLNLADTAGIRDATDVIEKIGVERSMDALGNAELVLAVFDGSQAATDEDKSFIDKILPLTAKKIAIVNKNDLAFAFDGDLAGFDRVIEMSAKNKEGRELLECAVEEMFASGEIDYDNSAVLSNARQVGAIKLAEYQIQCAIDALESGFTPDVAGMDIERAMAHLGECDGRAVSADIVDSIFHRFCVGK